MARAKSHPTPAPVADATTTDSQAKASAGNGGTDAHQEGALATGDASRASGGAGAAASTTDPAPGHELRAYVVTGPKKGRWRAGRRFDAEPQTVELTAREYEAIAADPVLRVEPVA